MADERVRYGRVSLGLAALVAHLPALGADFVLDDRALLADNPFVRTWSGLSVLVRRELFVASAEPRIVPYYRPISGALNWTTYQLFGARAPLQHALNLALHALVVLSLCAVLEAYRVRPRIAWAAALLFAVHPATAEVVAYLGGRQDMLGWLVALALLAVAHRAQHAWTACAIGFGATVVAALCHEFFLAFGAPLALACLRGRERSALGRALAAASGGGLATAAVLLLRRWLGLVPYEVGPLAWPSLVRSTVGVGLRLARDLVAPTDLAVDVTLAPASWAMVALAALAAAAVLWAAWRARLQRPADSFALGGAGLAILFLSAGLHAGVALKYGNISDRYAYAAWVGAVLACASLWPARPPTRGDTGRLLVRVRPFLAPGIALALVPLTWSRSAAWRDEDSLQRAMIADRPDDPESLLAAAMMKFGRGELDAAYPLCQAYAEARPGSGKAGLCLGIWLLEHGRPGDAVTVLRPYALSRPGVETARRAFLSALFASRGWDEAQSTLDAWSVAFPGAADLVEARRALEAARRRP